MTRREAIFALLTCLAVFAIVCASYGNGVRDGRQAMADEIWRELERPVERVQPTCILTEIR